MSLLLESISTFGWFGDGSGICAISTYGWFPEEVLTIGGNGLFVGRTDIFGELWS